MEEREVYTEPVVRMNNTPRRKKSLGVFLLVPLLFGVCVLMILSREWKEELKVRNIIVTGNRMLSSQYVVSLAGVQKASALFGINLFDVRQRILSQPFIKKVAVNRQFPDALSINIEERTPITSITIGQMRYLAADGIVLPSIQSQIPIDVPVISGVDGLQDLKIGEEVSQPEILEALHVIETAKEIDTTMYHFISEINMNSGRDIVLYTTDAGIPVYVGRGDIEKKLVTLQNFWSTVMKSQDPEKLRYLDLRYNDQVVAKWQHEDEKTPQQRGTLKKSAL